MTSDASRLIFSSLDSLSVHVWDLHKVRQQLAQMGLDWEDPGAPSLVPPPASAEPLRLTIDLGDLTGSPPTAGAPR
jgi:hypothetical protein